MVGKLQGTSARGYGGAHQKRRKQVAAQVAAGLARCWRCGRPILPGMPWDLGHDDFDRRLYRGPEHRHCNRSAGARKKQTMIKIKWTMINETIVDRW